LHPGGGAAQSGIGHPKKLAFVTPADGLLEEQPSPADSKFWFIAIAAMLFVMKVRSEIKGMPASDAVVAACEAGLSAAILLSAAGCANICAPANNRTGTSNRI